MQKTNKTKKSVQPPRPAIELPLEMTVGDFATMIGKSPVETVKELMRHKQMLSVNDRLDLTLAIKIAQSFQIPVKKPRQNEFDVENDFKPTSVAEQAKVDKSAWRVKPPVVTVMGHVDHGKTTLLDSIRGSSVAAKESGGITQRIGAYQVDYKGSQITFIDTPGHEMFTAMRSGGVQATDIALIVIAADDGVKPQTLEAINHAKSARALIMIAINKTDVEGADPDRVKFDLAPHGVVVESLGGDVIAVEVSAQEKTGIDDLIESIALLAEVNELKADYDGEVSGVVIESHMDKFKGPLATVIPSAGSLKLSDSIVVGMAHGRVRTMIDSDGKQLKLLTPGVPAQIMGIASLPNPGDKLEVVANDAKAKELIKVRQSMQQRQNAPGRAVTMLDVKRSAEQFRNSNEINLVLKAQTSGMLAALQRTIQNKTSGDAKINVIGSGIGLISVSDILLASVANGVVIGFDTGIEPGAKKQMSKSDVPVRVYTIIYRLIEDVEAGFRDLLGQEEREVMIGKARIKQIFPYGEEGKIAGIQVVEGIIERDARVRIARDGDEVYNGYLSSMRHIKDDVSQLKNQQEGGLMFREFTQFREDDEVEFYKVQKV